MMRCRLFLPLSPGHAAICVVQWQKLPWNAAVPLINKDNPICHCGAGIEDQSGDPAALVGSCDLPDGDPGLLR